MEFLAPLLQREVIIGLALCGGLISFAGNWLMRKKGTSHPKGGRVVLHAGYALTGLSVVLFIVAGVATAYR